MSLNVKDAPRSLQKLSGSTITIASAQVLGGIKVGANLTITDDGTLSATASAPKVDYTTDGTYVALTK